MESRDILKVKDQLKDPTKMFEKCWLLGYPTTTRKPGLKDYGLSKAKKHRALHSGIKTSPYEAMFGMVQKIVLGDSLLTEDIHSSIETEEQLEQPFNAGMRSRQGRQGCGHQQDRKDEDENHTNDTSEETVEKKDIKKFTA